MRSKMAVAGHPIHPALVALPIGILVWALVANIIYAFTDHNLTWYDVAQYSSLAGIITGLAAAVPGLGDYLTIGKDSDARDMGIIHAVLNVTVLALFAIAFALMLDRNADGGGMLTIVIVLQALGVGLLSMSGWIGGEMVFRKHLGVVADDADLEQAEERRHHGPARPALGRQHR